MNNIVSLFMQSPTTKKLLKAMDQDKYSYYADGMTVHTSYLLAYASYLQYNTNVVYVASNLYKANQAYIELVHLAGVENVTLYVADEAVSLEVVTANSELKYERINTMKAACLKQPKIIVADIAALLRPIMAKDEYYDSILHFKTGLEIDVNEVINKLIQGGYTRVPTTYAPGEFSVRGEVIDIYPITSLNPIRLNLFDIEIETIKEYNYETQISTNKLNEVYVYPLNELIIKDTSNIKQLIDNLNQEEKDFVVKDLNDMEACINNDKMFKYIKYLSKEVGHFLDYLDDKIVLLNELSTLKEKYQQLLTETHNYVVEHKITKLDLMFYDDFNVVELDAVKKIYISNRTSGISQIELLGMYDFNAIMVNHFDNNFKYFIEWIKEKRNEAVVLGLSSLEKIDIIKSLLNDNNIKYYVANDLFNLKTNSINLIIVKNTIGYGLKGEVVVLSDNEIFQRVNKKTKYRSVIQNVNKYNSKEDLKVGDYVVHYDYGIGQYLGLKTVELGGIVKDYLQLKYQNVEVLVPVEKITLLERYQGSEGTAPRLTKVGTNEWEKKKDAVRNQLESIAQELIDVQIKRSSAVSKKYLPDSEFQELFEADFEYEETPDQLRIVKEIKEDMENGKLVDRLVCGDVGFGKTEIAMRIAFKTVYEGEQVAYLAPTTILTRQHYISFKERFEKYGIKVAMLNRLVTEREQNQILRDLKNGNINVVIGTHRLLSKDVRFKNLGLLVIDEEQRFGVVHKEGIKKLKTNVNVLTLSATPIPRTLQMAVSGLRQLSVIETPPNDRYPIQTYVLEHNWVLVKEAIYREMGRGGQVFYLHNRISDVENIAKKIQKYVPEARICIGHGKMPKEQLEDTIQAFIDHEYDVLVCTTIIETGIDIPNTNTLIIEDANRLGLAQMYQVRGRVGRSDKIAYAYLTYQPDKAITKTGEKRLEAITEYTKIGSGYKIAVRDLVIRGAGDVLGREQSGFIDSVGIDMYMRLLDEAIKKTQGIETKVPTQYKIEVNKHVEDTYVSDDAIKIYIHQTINSIETKAKKNNVINELIDRFGKVSEDILMYIEEIYLESLLRKANIKVVNESETKVSMFIPEDESNRIKGDKLVMAGYTISDRFLFEYRSRQMVVVINKLPNKNDKTWIKLAVKMFEKVLEMLNIDN